MSARVVQVARITPSCDYWRGYGTRELLAEVSGRVPVWGPLVRAWHCQPSTSADAIALAESRGWHVEVIDEARLVTLAGAELAEARGVLW